MAAGRVRGAVLGIVVILANILLVAGLVTLVSGGDEPSTVASDDQEATSGSTPTPGSATRTAAPPPVDTSSTTSAESPEEATETAGEQASLAERYADEEDLTVVVLGDQTGSDPADWALTWARQLSSERVVEIYQTSASDGTVYLEPEVIGVGAATISFYNASRIGGTPEYAAERVEVLVPEEADLVLLNYGRSNGEDDISRHLGQLNTALGERRPQAEVRVIVQPPRQDGLPPLADLTRAWATVADVATIDVASVFAEEGIVESTVSTRDPLSVNLFGADRWAQIVHEELFSDDG